MAKRGRPHHPDVLTPREEEVLQLVREGRTNPEIAERLGIALETVKHHVSEILAKLEVTSREEAAAWRSPRPDVVRWVLALVGTLVVVAAVAGVALLAWGVLKTDDHAAPDEPSTVVESHEGRLTDEQANGAQLVVTMPGPNQEQMGAVWLARLDGTVTRQLSVASGVQQRDFIRVAPSIKTGNAALYYAAGQWEGDKTIFRLDLTTGEGEEIGTIPKCCSNLFGARTGPRTDVSPDGRYIVLFEGELLDTLVRHDLQTGEDLAITTRDCKLSCQYWNIEWSPTGDYILASYYGVDEPNQSFLYDASGNFLASDLFADGVWSPSGDAICDVQSVDTKPFLEIRRAPDWTPQRFLEDLALNNVPSPVSLGWFGPRLAGCTWLGDGQIAVWQNASPDGVSQSQSHLITLDLDSGDFTQINLPLDCHFESLMSASDSLVVMRSTNGGQICPGPFVEAGPNNIIDVDTGVLAISTEPGTEIEAVIPTSHPSGSLRTSARKAHY